LPNDHGEGRALVLIMAAMLFFIVSYGMGREARYGRLLPELWND